MKKLLLTVSLALLFLVSCTAETRHRVLTTLFDGVDDPEKKAAPAGQVQAEAPGELPAAAPVTAVVTSAHPSFAEKMCADCHEVDQGYRLTEPQPQLCFSCHEDPAEQFAVLHGPVAGGYCTECHSPHRANAEKLLLRTGRDMCLHCHESADVLKNEVHEDIEDTDCMECHNPHGGDDRFLMQ
jgi:predicted CXXCH cytochrome family protein